MTDKPITVKRFAELKDGEYFYYAHTYRYGSRHLLQKLLEDGDHNVVWHDDTNTGSTFHPDTLCIPTTKPEA